MAGLTEFLRKGDIASSHRPFARAGVGVEMWNEAIAALAGGQWQLLALWGEPDRVHMALRDEADEAIAPRRRQIAPREHERIACGPHRVR